MSRKKSNKVKKYLRRRNLVKNIGTIIAVFLFFIVCGVMAAFLVLGSLDSHLLACNDDMQRLVTITNQYWDNQRELDEQILAEMEMNRAFNQVLFVDDDFNVIRQIDLIRDLGEDGKKSFQKTELYPEEIEAFYTKGIYKGITVPEISEKNVLRLFGLLDFKKTPTTDELVGWAQADEQMLPDWFIYSTAVESVNVCARYVSIWDTFQCCLFSFALCFAAIVLILVFSSGVIFITSIIRRSRYANRIIYTDPVTGGFNRDYFIDCGLNSIKQKKRYAVVRFKLEKYGNYCTAYGLKQGEKLLENIYWIAKECLSKKEIIAHLEDADFAMVLQYTDNRQLETRLKEMTAGFNTCWSDRHLSFAAGVYPVQSKRADMSDILTSAGLALAKAEKQNAAIVWFNDEMKAEQLWERHVEDDMEKALARHEFQVYLQPKYSTKKEKLAAAEALVRWLHPDLGFISPGKFIPIFETNGFILQLDDYMLREIARLQAQWLKEGKQLVPISVNVSRAHFSMDDLAEHICSIVDEYKVPHKYIELELTESAFFDDKATLLMTVKKLKAYGFKISMDDFGAGYSSLNSLKELPLDIIKLDAEFFRGIDDVKRANAIVGDTIALAKKLGMEIVAEGIETREQVDFLAGQDCDLIQGFYFAKPLPVAEFTKRAWG